MTSLVLGLDFITGRCTATSASDRESPEWPPHPGRVFMALAATCFERGEDPSEVAALEWLESLDPPEMEASECFARTNAKFYVPVNDRLTPNKSLLQATPGLTRSKQERNYPTVIPHDPVVRYVWHEIADGQDHLEALAAICANTIRVGHSSSLVHAWVQFDDNEQAGRLSAQQFRWIPSKHATRHPMRIVDRGTFSRLREQCGAKQIEQFADLALQIQTSQGKAKKDAQNVFQAIFGEPYKKGTRPPEPISPTLGIWQGYTREIDQTHSADQVVTEGDHFESELLILAKSPDVESRVIAIEDSLAVTRRFREAIFSQVDDSQEPIPEWLSGHQPDGSPTQLPHIAFLPLPFVGTRHADGHLMGVALALPKQVAAQQWQRWLGPVLFDERGEFRKIELLLGQKGEWTLQWEQRIDPPRTLCNATWTQASHIWSSATPVVLDRFPKASRSKDRAAWEEEVRGIVARACQLAGMPLPEAIDVGTTSWLTGASRACPKKRRMRGVHGKSGTASLGDGFPSYASRSGQSPRPQVHVRLEFRQLVRGPVLLGAGRFLGYGLCQPIADRKATR